MNIHSDGPEALIGTRIANYQLIKVLGYGGTGAVYLGRNDKEPLPTVAVKILFIPWQLSADERKAFRDRFRRKAQVMLSLRHPHILPVEAFGEEQGLLYIIMPYLSGGTLRSLLDERSDVLELRVIAQDLTSIAQAIDYAHAHKIIHRDIKPSNIMYDRDGQIYLGDFSIAAFQDPTRTEMTTAGKLMGTPAYMAPEIVRGQRGTTATARCSLI